MGNPIVEAVAAVNKKTRPVYLYDVPQSVPGDIRCVGLVELTSEDELDATKRARGDTMRLAFELAKQSLVEVNEKPVTQADGSVDSAWDKMGAQVRNLVLTAYAKLHAPSEGVAEGFLKSQRVRVT